jgi:hypothetical protein
MNFTGVEPSGSTHGAAGRGPRWPDSLGLFAGAGIVCLVIAVIGAVAGPTWWAVIGLALAAVGGGASWWLRCRPMSR